MLKKNIILICLIILSLYGCKEGSQPQQTVAQKPRPASTETATAVQKDELKVEKEVYTYEPKGRRDPFMSLVEIAKQKPQRKKGAHPIENFDIEEIKLIAIAWDNQQYYALITLPDGKSYTIKKGMTLGLNEGKVVNITKDTVIVTEKVKDYRGQMKTKDTILKLRKEGEE